MDEGAAFGFFPQLRPRRRLQDPTASADVPLQVLRGRLAGLLGLPADIGNIFRSPMPMEMFGDYEYEKPPQLPYTTEYFLKELPLAPTAPIGQLAGQAASFVPLNPAPLVRGVQKVGTMVGEGMAERVATGRPMLPSLLAEPQAAMFAVEPNVPRMNLLDTPPETMTSLLEVKPQAAVSDLGFYSAAEQAALNLQRNKGSGQAFLNDLLKAENVKKDELQWMGVDDFLKEKPNVTKQEVQDFIANNRVDVQEVRLGEMLFEDPRGIAKRKEIFDKYEPEILRLYDELDNVSYNDPTKTRDLTYQIREIQDLRNSQADAAYTMQEAKPARYDQYQLPGGENYREILMTLPKQSPTTNDIASKLFGKEMRFLSEAEKDAVVAEARRIEDTTPKDYVSSHFNEPNILAHIRVNDRVDADGKKMLLIEEIQSDWHQAGREMGYNKKLTQAESDELRNLQKKEQDEDGLFEADVQRINELEKRSMGGVPDAPFKDTWYQLALKRVLKHAADNGYERVGLTTGKQQADRYKMSNEVNSLAWRDAGGGVKRAISLELVNGDNMTLSVNNEGKVMGGNFEDKSLSSVLGKDLAKKIMAEDNGNLMGNGLNIGGEGMKKYYDEVYPQYLDKYGKKWNAKVGETRIKTGQGIPGGAPVRYIDITPEMKGAVSKGQPLFAATPALPLGAQGLLGEPEKKKELSLLD